MRRFALAGLTLFVAGLAYAGWRVTREAPLPPGLAGTLIYVSERGGSPTLLARDLSSGVERRLTYFSEAVKDPALAPDGRRVAFSVGGRIGIVELGTRDVRVLTYGIDWKDEYPAWRPDGRALLVAARRPGEPSADLMLLHPLDPTGQATGRRPLVTTRGLDESEPVFTPDGRAAIFVREGDLFRIEIESGRARRLTGGFRKWRQPRFSKGGQLLALWREEKRFGADLFDAQGRSRAPLFEGTTAYRTLTPSPDGRFFAATYSFDLGFRSLDALLRPGHVEEIRLLDAKGVELGPLLRAWRIPYSSPQWAAGSVE